MNDYEKSPLLLIIFGITGDLAKRKLLPALHHLLQREDLPDDVHIVGVSRQDVDVDELIKSISTVNPSLSTSDFTKLKQHLSLRKLDLSQKDGYYNLAEDLKTISQNLGPNVNRIYYLSIPAQAFSEIISHLGDTGHADIFPGEVNLPKILVEKPFGFDTESAQTLIDSTEKYYQDNQVYRIDHYLAKETAQNILIFRFNNPLFQSIWNSKFIEKIKVSAFESIGVEGRANFYEKTGALRDLIQSHLLQLLALVTMEEPKILDSAGIHRSKIRLLDSIEQIAENDVIKYASRGQYEGYRDEVSNQASNTETFARLQIVIDNEQWRGTEIFVESGKGLDERISTITIYFRGNEKNTTANTLEFRLQPKEGITISLQAKKPGLNNATERVEMDFDYARSFGASSSEAYERVIIDAVRGDQTLFASSAEVMSSWRIVEKVLDNWQKSDKDVTMYPFGSNPEKL